MGGRAYGLQVKFTNSNASQGPELIRLTLGAGSGQGPSTRTLLEAGLGQMVTEVWEASGTGLVWICLHSSRW